MDAMEALRAAAEAAGVDVNRMEEEAALPDVVPPDEHEVERQAALTQRKADRGKVCVVCDAEIGYLDKGVLREVRGWSRDRDDGGQNHVIDRVQTGRLMCGPCGIRLRSGLSHSQETLV